MPETPLQRTHTGGIDVTLTCGGCGQRKIFRPWFRLTKMSVLRLEGGVHGWYVDGGSVFCPICVGDCKHRTPQLETWREWDRRSVEDEQQEEADLDELINRNPGIVGRVLEANRRA